jgi:soluble P-type ATPase
MQATTQHSHLGMISSKYARRFSYTVAAAGNLFSAESFRGGFDLYKKQL